MARRYRLALAFAVLAIGGVAGCGSPETSTSYSSEAFLVYQGSTLVRPLTPYTGARLFSEDNEHFRFRALGCEFDVQYALGDSQADRIAAAQIESAQGQLLGGGNGPIQFGGRLVNGRATAGDGAGTGMPCDTITDVLTFVGTRRKIGGDRTEPVAMIASSRWNTLYAFPMKTDRLTPAQAADARSKASGFALKLLETWATR